MESYKCVLCKESFYGYGNNAQPLAEGLCCDDCNFDVIQERINEMEEKVHSKK